MSFNWNRPTKPIIARKYFSYKEAQAFTKKIYRAWETAQTIIKKV